MNPDFEISNKIEILPEHIIDQIKAGEVLERPASLIKELIENSIDAGSTDIQIHLVENGLELFSIIDNGKGMDFDNLPFAFLRHATSKLKTFEDLYHLRSFGFRGEALASIAASSRLTCTSQPKKLDLSGGKISINGGATEYCIPYKSNESGTSLFIKDLFYNTPARLKFIKSKTSEKSALKKMIYSFVLANPQITFSIKWDDKEKEIYKNTTDHKKRISQVFYLKSSLDDQILFETNEYDNYKIEVYVSKLPHSSPQYRHHYLYVNNRIFQDKSLHSAVLRTLDPIWKFQESGHYVIKLFAPPEEIDVNVHPNKTQIKFMKSDIIYSLLVSTLKSALKPVIAQNVHGHDHIGQFSSQNFFTKDENQDIDLTHMRIQSDASNGFNDRFVNQDQPVSSSSNSYRPDLPFEILSIIQDRILIFKAYDKIFIADIPNTFIDYISTELENFKKKELTPGPLLISEPFQVTNKQVDDCFEELKNLGIELDRLNKEVIVLRTLPSFIPQNLSRDIVEIIIQYFENNKTLQFNSQEFQSFAKVKNKIIPFNNILFEKIFISKNDRIDSFATELTLTNLKSLLK